MESSRPFICGCPCSDSQQPLGDQPPACSHLGERQMLPTPVIPCIWSTFNPLVVSFAHLCVGSSPHQTLVQQLAQHRPGHCGGSKQGCLASSPGSQNPSERTQWYLQLPAGFDRYHLSGVSPGNPGVLAGVGGGVWPFLGQLGSARDVKTDPGPRKTQFLTLSTGSELGVFGESLDLSGLFPHLEDGPTALKATEQLSHTALSGPSVDPGTWAEHRRRDAASLAPQDLGRADTVLARHPRSLLCAICCLQPGAGTHLPWGHLASSQGLPRWLRGKESACQCGRSRFNPCIGKIPWRKKRQPIPVFSPRKSHGQRSLAGYSPRGHMQPHVRAPE